jgi:hypothetical protein
VADAIDFAIALNVQHGSNYENIELHFGFSREEGNIFNGKIVQLLKSLKGKQMNWVRRL